MSDYSEIPECVSALKDADTYAFDTETTGLCVRSDSIIGASFTVKKKKDYRSWYFKPSPEMPVEQLFKHFEPVFLDGQKLSILHNAKFDLQMLKRHNIKFFNKICCTKVMAWIINENRIGHLSLKGDNGLTKELFNIVLPSYEESSLSGSLFGKEEEAYAMDDTLYGYKVYEKLLPELEKQGLSKLFWDLEMQILPIVADMEIRGMYVDVPTLHNLEKTLLEKYDSIAQEFYTKAGRKINIGSPEQLSAFFFDELKWEPKPGMERSKKGLYPTGEAILSKYAENDHKELSQLVLDYRGVLKLLQTYVRPLTKLALDDSHSRIHSTINQTGTVTGRFCVAADTEVTCSHGQYPITQVKAGDFVLTHEGRFRKVLNVIYKGMERMWTVRTSRNHKIRCTMNHRFLTPEGWKSLREIHFNDTIKVMEGSELVYDTLSWFMPSEVEDVWDLEVEEDHSYVGNGFVNHNSSSSPNLQNIPREKGTIKVAFKSPPGKTLIVADMSQLELRIMSHLSQDPTMLEIYRTGGDIHDTTQKAVGCKERATAKNINFGLIYGMGPQTFQANLWRTARVALSIAECQKFDRAFFKKYPAIKDYHDTVDQFLRKHKYVRTLTGRRRHLADEMKANYGSALRQAINFTVQGLGADIVKIAMRNFQRELLKKRLDTVSWEEVFMVMQVHDEIVIESPLEIAQEASDLLKQCMETAVTLSIPLIAEPKIAGPDGSWEDCK